MCKGEKNKKRKNNRKDWLTKCWTVETARSHGN